MDDQPDSRLSGRRRAADSVPLLYAISPCRPAGGPHGLLLVYGGQARIYAQNHKKAIPKALVWTSPAARALCRHKNPEQRHTTPPRVFLRYFRIGFQRAAPAGLLGRRPLLFLPVQQGGRLGLGQLGHGAEPALNLPGAHPHLSLIHISSTI